MSAVLPEAIDLAKAIQLVLTPAFLLTAISGLLNVMTGRLARIIDRGRAFAEGRVTPAAGRCPATERERQSLEARRHLVSVAVAATTVAALLLCVVIAALFVEVMLTTPMRWLVSALFATAMAALVVGLAYFLCETRRAMQTAPIVLPAPALAPARPTPEARRIATAV